MKCITCGENEAINDFYRECEGCIIEFEREKFHWKDMDNRDWYWKYIDVKNLTPAQQKHFKTIMRKKVRE